MDTKERNEAIAFAEFKSKSPLPSSSQRKPFGRLS